MRFLRPLRCLGRMIGFLEYQRQGGSALFEFSIDLGPGFIQCAVNRKPGSLEHEMHRVLLDRNFVEGMRNSVLIEAVERTRAYEPSGLALIATARRMLTAPNFNVPIQSPASEWGPDLAGGGLSSASAEIPHVRTAHSAATGNFQDLFIIGAFISWMFRAVRNLSQCQRCRI